MTKSRGIIPPCRRRPWSDEDLALLRRHYPDMPTETLAVALDRSVHTLYQKAGDLGLRKSAAYLAGPHACRLRRGDNVGMGHRFKPGDVPWNAGTSFVAGGRSAETRFKAGRPPQEARNYLPIGSLRINDDYLERKTTDDPALVPARRWTPVHRLVWEAAYGPVPPGHAVVFLPGRRTTDLSAITLDAVDLVTRAELMRRNTIHRYPTELKQAIRLVARVKRKLDEQDHQ